MSRLAVCVLTAFFLLPAVNADGQTDLTETYGLSNGRFWNSLDADLRPAYLEGIAHGWKLREETENSTSGAVLQALSSGSVSLTYEELAEMITSAYRDPENRTLPIGWVMMAEMAVHRGETTSARVLAALRKRLLEMSDKNTVMVGNQISPIGTILAAGKNHEPPAATGAPH